MSGIIRTVTPFSTIEYIVPVPVSMIKEGIKEHEVTGHLKNYIHSKVNSNNIKLKVA